MGHCRRRDVWNRRRPLRISQAGIEVVKAAVGWIFPGIVAALTAVVALNVDAAPAVSKGVAAGVAIAAAQSYLSTGALRWSWNRPYFWWVWGAGVLLRFVVFAAVAFGIYRFTQLSFVATMTSMVGFTTLFMVVESAVCLKG